MSERVVVLCPGRGSYGAGQLGSLHGLAQDPRATDLARWVRDTDVRRTAAGSQGLLEIDAAESFSARWLRAEHAAPLIYAVGVRDALRLDPQRARVVAVGGNSMGWYTALVVAGALSVEAGGRLVETMAAATDGSADGGQIIYPVVNDDWLPDPDRAVAVEEALARVVADGARAGHSIRYGGYAVLWADEPGLEALVGRLPSVKLGKQQYPLRLGGNGPFHSPLMAAGSAAGRAELEDLEWGAPSVPLIDGRGAQWRPLATEPDALSEYTLETQVTETFDFAATVRVALREYAPDRLVLLGPGETLGSAVAQVLIRERWRGITDRESFLARQGEDPFVVALARPEQAAILA